MAKGKGNGKGLSSRSEAIFAKTATNLARKGKTNKKLKSNPNAKKYNQRPLESTMIKQLAKKYRLLLKVI